MRNNPYRYNAPPHWNDISTAPRDGTPIEIQNNWGVAPWYGVYRWVDGDWRSTSDQSGVSDGPHLSWRPYDGEVTSYTDPAGGAQNTRNYWLQACGMPPVQGGDLTFEEEAELDRKTPTAEVIAATNNRPWWKRLFATR